MENVQVDRSGEPLRYPDPVQPGGTPDQLGGDGRVHRQVGLAPTQQVGFDPTPPPPIIQGDANMVVTRNAGPHVTQRFGAYGTLQADHRADDNILSVDHALSDPEALPPGLARTAIAHPPPPGFGDMPAVEQRAAIKAQAEAMGFVVSDAPAAAGAPPAGPPVVDVMQADQPGSGDPRDLGGPAKVFTASDLPVVKKRAIVPVVVSVRALPKARKGGKR